ncbi:MAG: hypothetical protein QXK98_04665, partial [Candidatus Bathyarchaeia archaeon]
LASAKQYCEAVLIQDSGDLLAHRPSILPSPVCGAIGLGGGEFRCRAEVWVGLRRPLRRAFMAGHFATASGLS